MSRVLSIPLCLIVMLFSNAIAVSSAQVTVDSSDYAGANRVLNQLGLKIFLEPKDGKSPVHLIWEPDTLVRPGIPVERDTFPTLSKLAVTNICIKSHFFPASVQQRIAELDQDLNEIYIHDNHFTDTQLAKLLSSINVKVRRIKIRGEQFSSKLLQKIDWSHIEILEVVAPENQLAEFQEAVDTHKVKRPATVMLNRDKVQSVLKFRANTESQNKTKGAGALNEQNKAAMWFDEL